MSCGLLTLRSIISLLENELPLMNWEVPGGRIPSNHPSLMGSFIIFTLILNFPKILMGISLKNIYFQRRAGIFSTHCTWKKTWRNTTVPKPITSIIRFFWFSSVVSFFESWFSRKLQQAEHVLARNLDAVRAHLYNVHRSMVGQPPVEVPAQGGDQSPPPPAASDDTVDGTPVRPNQASNVGLFQ